MVRAIIFDCFGVLVTEAWLPFKAKYFGRDQALYQQATDIAKQANQGLISQEDFIKAVSRLAGTTVAETGRYISRNVPDEALFEYIKELKQSYKIGFLSNIAADYLNRMFTPEQLAMFDALTLSFESGNVKPEPKAYQDAATQLGVEVGECVLADDQERNVAGAQTAGMQAILYHDVEQFKKELGQLLADPKS